jgi:hypothetical protein
LAYFKGICYIFPLFGKLNQEKSGNHGAQILKRLLFSRINFMESNLAITYSAHTITNYLIEFRLKRCKNFSESVDNANIFLQQTTLEISTNANLMNSVYEISKQQ